jgi:hypothetical protein
VDISQLLPPRSIEDILFERVRLVIGGEVYDLPALVIEENEKWKAQLDTELMSILTQVNDAGDDVSQLVAALTGEPERLLRLLRSYDQTNVLPDDDVLRKSMTPMLLVRSVLEVWRAANPLVDIGLVGLTISAATESASPKPTSLPRRNGAGRPVKSGAS